MIPGMNPRDVAKAMKKLGIKQDELDASKVVITLKDKELVFDNPKVSCVNMMGEESYQIVGSPEARSLTSEPEISEDDIKTVAQQANVGLEEAKEAILKHNGDLAEAILELTAPQ